MSERKPPKPRKPRVLRPHRCPDCDLRNDLNALGVPLPARRYLKFGTKNCETCENGKTEFSEW